jgi:hypothetical protein
VDPPPAVAAEVEDASQLDVLLVGDTVDESIRDGVGTDLGRMRVLLEMGVPETRRTITVLAGAEATAEAIRRHYEEREPRPDEARLFYFAGHGVWTAEGSELQLPGGAHLPRARLRAWVGHGAPRLAVLLTDCCSTYVGMAAMYRRLAPDPDTFRDLFFRHLGVVDVTAAKPGQAAVGDGLAGGYFTTGIMDALAGLSREELDADRSGIVTWPEALAVVTSQTEGTFDAFHPEGLTVGQVLQRDQTPFALGDLARSTGHAIPRGEERVGVSVEDAPDGGARIVAVLPDSPAAWAGLLVGERIRGLAFDDPRGEEQQRDVGRVAELAAALAEVRGSRLVTLTVAPRTGGADATARLVPLRLAR